MLSLSKHPALRRGIAPLRRASSVSICVHLWLALALLALACAGDAVAPPPTATQPAVAPAPDVPSGPITIAAVGDVVLDRDMIPMMEQDGAGSPFAHVAALLQDADLTVANLEAPFTERGAPADKTYTFRVPPRFARGLVEAGIDVVSLGNNHAADYGTEGLVDTLATLTDLGIAYTGAGDDDASARRPALVTVRGLTLAFLSYTDVDGSAFAGPDTPGVAFADPTTIAADVAAARGGADAVIVMLHFGIEYTDAPQPAQQTLARAAIDAGALLVLGHHPHTLQGWERYGGGVIAYSLGNFVFDLDDVDRAQLGERAAQTAVLYVTLTAGEVLDVRAEPVTIDAADGYRPRPASSAEASAILARLADLNQIAGGP